MSRPARTLPRSLSCLLCALALLLAGTPPVKGDVTRNGGIIILPSATHMRTWGKAVRASYAFGAGTDMPFQMDPSLGTVVAIADTGSSTVPLGTVCGSVLTVRYKDVISLRNAGVDTFRLRVMDRALRGYELEFSVTQSGDVIVRVF